jgi:hypothetical protein
MDALGSWAGLCVLDAGCGTGRHTGVPGLSAPSVCWPGTSPRNARPGTGLALYDLRDVVATPALCEQSPALEELRGHPVLRVLSGQK